MRSPYAEGDTQPVFAIKDLFGNYQLPAKSRKTERGELLKYFATKLQWPISRVAYKLQGYSVQDFYYIQSVCDMAEREGKKKWSHAFNSALFVPKDGDATINQAP